MKTEREDISAIELGILWDKLISITDEVFNTLVRTAFSPVLREGRDGCAVIMDRQGKSVAQSTLSLPVFIGTVPVTTKHLLKKFPISSMKPGDVFITNDPWMGSGHLNDATIIRPIFCCSELVAFVGTVSHLPDIGGIGYSATAREVFEEGLNIPITRLVDEGQLNQELLDIIGRNVRLEHQVIGDIKAAISAGHLCERRIAQFIRGSGVSKLGSLFALILERSEAAVRAKIMEMPQGEYEDEVWIEANQSPVHIKCRVTVNDQQVKVDYSGTSGCVAEAINVPMCFAHSWTAYAIKCVISPSIPNNEGSLAPLEVVAPEGCILNAPYPLAVAARHLVGHFLPQVVFGALCKAVPSKVMADSGLFSALYFCGRDPKGLNYAMEYNPNGGFGATAHGDGYPSTAFPLQSPVISTEVWEASTGLRVETRAIKPDTGGPGKYRGGQGQVVVIRNVTGEPVRVSITISRTEYPPRGFLGGKNGTCKKVFINGTAAHPRSDHILAAGDSVRLEDAGGGGLFDPSERPAENVLADVLNGLVSPESAENDYAVKVDFRV